MTWLDVVFWVFAAFLGGVVVGALFVGWVLAKAGDPCREAMIREGARAPRIDKRWPISKREAMKDAEAVLVAAGAISAAPAPPEPPDKAPIDRKDATTSPPRRSEP